MVGNSFGGGNVQLYAYRYPQEVNALVLVEAQHEDETERLNRASGGKLKAMYAMQDAGALACASQAETGFVPGSELWANCIGPFPDDAGRALGAAQIAERRSARYWRAAQSENASFEIGNAELRAARKHFGDLPLIVLTRGVSPYAIPGKRQSAANKATELENVALHKEMAALSTRGKHRIVPGAAHIIQADRPEAVVQAVGEALDQLAR